jgi:hypothetical protein
MEWLLAAIVVVQDETVVEAVRSVRQALAAGRVEESARLLEDAARRFRGDKRIVTLAAGYVDAAPEALSRSAVRALGTVRHKDAIDVLVAAADKPGVAEVLRTATGQDIAEAAGWAAWWKRSRATFKFPDRRAATDVAGARKRLGDADAFRETASEHYLVLSDAPEARVKEFLPQFEKLHEMMRKEYPFPDLDRLLIVYFFKDEAGIRTLSDKERGGAGGGMMGGFASRDGYLAFYESARLNLDHIVFHEGAHQILFNGLGIADPNWFHEGMAEYVAATNRGSGAMVAQAVKQLIRDGQALPLEKLFAEGVRGRREAYLQSGTVVRFLREKHGEKAFRAWLRELALGRSDAAKHFGYASPRDLEAAWKEHWK